MIMDTVPTSLATIISSSLIKYVKLDNIYYGPLHTLVVSFILYLQASNQIVFDILTAYFGYLVFGVCVFLCLFYRDTFYSSFRHKKLNSDLFDEISIYEKTMYDFETYIENHITSETVKKVIKNYKTMYSTDQTLFFNDKSIGVYGKFSVREKLFEVSHTNSYSYEIEVSKTGTRSPNSFLECRRYIELYVNSKSSKKASEYIKYISTKLASRKFIEKEQKSLVYYRYSYSKTAEFKEYSNAMVFNNGNSVETMDTFFHPKKEYILDNFSKFKYENIEKTGIDKIYQTGMLLYGPPGTGKSNFIYKLANYLKRDIISVDLSTITKNEFYSILIGFGRVHSLHTSIIAFDEFDYVMQLIHTRDSTTISLPKKSVESVESVEQSKSNSSAKPSIPTTKEGLLTINDLLNVFCGIVPFNGAIFMATTNHYDKIREICPAMFRDGRLEPVLFDFFDKTDIDNICMHFFNKKLNLSDLVNNKICNATIMKLATKYSEVENGFDKFSKDFERLIIDHNKLEHNKK